MAKTLVKKSNNYIIKTVEKKFGVPLGYKTDQEMHHSLIKRGFPALSQLLKMVHKTQ